MRQHATPSRWRGRACALILALAVVAPAAARAHSTTYAVYSKYEATTAGRSIGFVFALDRAAVLALLERDAAHAKVPLEAVSEHRAFFSQYLFQRFAVSNDGVACSHPAELGRFFW